MAACEECGTGGFSATQMHASRNGQKLIGPCCQSEPEMELDWGVSLSSKRGLEAYASYGDLRVTYQKSYEDLKQLVNGIQ